MKPCELIKLLEKEDSRLAKLALVRDNITPELENGFKVAFDPFIVLGIKKMPVWKATIYNDTGLPDSKIFYELCQDLYNRLLTGNAAIEAVKNFANQCSKDEWEFWYKRILQKDMKCGFGVDSWNTLAPTPIKIFECQLAVDTPEDDVETQMGKGDVFIEPKFDGVRAIAFVYPADNKVLLFSRNGKLFDNFNEVEEELLKMNLPSPMMFDGEMMSKNFQSLMTQVNRKENVDTTDAVYHIFDCMPLEQYEAKYCPFSQKKRKEWLEQILYIRDSEKVVLSPYEYVAIGDKERVNQAFKLFVKEGFEGLMMKDAEGLYTFERGKEWMKLKPFIELTLTVTDVIKGSDDSKYANTMGALICEGADGDKKVKTNCGSGFTDQQRAQIWANFTKTPVTWKKKVKKKWVEFIEYPTRNELYSILGRKVDVRADGLTLSADSETWSMRFPRWARFREGWDL